MYALATGSYGRWMRGKHAEGTRTCVLLCCVVGFAPLSHTVAPCMGCLLAALCTLFTRAVRWEYGICSGRLAVATIDRAYWRQQVALVGIVSSRVDGE